jgi:hypothetical protein
MMINWGNLFRFLLPTIIPSGEISGSHNDEYEDGYLLGCCTM